MSAPMKSLRRSLALWVMLPALALGGFPARALGAGATQLLKKWKDTAPANEPAALAASASTPYVDLGPLLGHVSSSNALVWVKASGPARLSVRVGQKSDLSDGTE